MKYTTKRMIAGMMMFTACLMVLTIGAPAAWAASPVGEWNIVTDAGGQETESILTITEENGVLSGILSGDAGDVEVTDAAFADDTLTFNVSIDAGGQALDLAFSGEIDGDSITVSWGSDFGDFLGSGTRGSGVSPVGEWNIVTDAGGQETASVLTITEENGTLSGTLGGDTGDAEVTDAAFSGNTLTFDVSIDAGGQALDLAFSGEIDGDSITVSWSSDFGDFPGSGTRGPGVSPVGEWNIVTDAGGQETASVLTITEDGGTLSGTLGGDTGDAEITDAAFSGNTLTFNVSIDAGGQALDLAFSGEIDGDSITVSWSSDFGDFPGTGTRGGGGSISVAGDWTVVTEGQPGESTLSITDSNGTISGALVSDLGSLEIGNPSFEEGVLKFDITIDAQGQTMELGFVGTVDGDSIDGNWTSDFGDFPVSATKN